MKKTLLAAFFAGAVLSGSAAEIDINGSFTGNGFGGKGFYWYTNSYLKPKVTRHQLNGGIAIQIKSVNDKDGQVYSGPVPGKAGDVFTLSVMAKGSGEGRLELMLYDKNNRYAGMLKSVNFKVSKEMVKYTKVFTVPAQSGKEVAFVRVAFLTVKGGDIYYQNAKLDKK